MTKKQFEKKYSNGISLMIYSFNKAVYEIFSTDAIDRIIKSEKWYRRKKLRNLKSYLKDIKDEYQVPHWLLIMNMAYSPVFYKFIIFFMIKNCHEKYIGEDLE